MRPAVPPLSRPNKDDASSISHVLIRVHAKPRVDMKRKLRFEISVLRLEASRQFDSVTHVQDLFPPEDIHVLLILVCALELAFGGRCHLVAIDFQIRRHHIGFPAGSHD